MPSTTNPSPSRLDIEYLNRFLKDFFPGLPETMRHEIKTKMTWHKLNAGEILFHQGDAGDSFYILLSGRLQAIVQINTPQENVVGEVVKGESVGEMALITGDPRTATIRAVRDSFLVKLGQEDFEKLALQDPSILRATSRQVIQRLNHSIHRVKPQKNYSNIAVLPLGNLTDKDFSEALYRAMDLCSQVLKIDQQLVQAEFDQSSEDHDDALTHWLSEKETQYDILLYLTTGKDNGWTRRCLRQTDKVLIVVDANAPDHIKAKEAQILKDYKGICELVIIHPPETSYPENTRRILERFQVQRHYHIRAGNQRDYQRIGRILSGKANALVLSGGGAKGFAHVGVYQALTETRIPIDIVAGTSIGSIMAAAIAMDWSPDDVWAKCREAFLKEKPLKDYTLPMVSLLYGRKFQQVIRKYFQDIQIEDLWINFFCISSNFSTSEPVLHHEGPLYKALAASASIPGVLPPIVEGNNLLVDGGLFNNFPVDIMRQLYDCHIIGIDLNAEKQYDLNYDRIPSGWRYMLSNFLRLGKRYRIPGIATILMKATILGSRQRQAEMREEVDLYLQPPVERYKLLDMKAFDPLVETGYQHARQVLSETDLSQVVYVEESGKELLKDI